jgi:hypothetical protein
MIKSLKAYCLVSLVGFSLLACNTVPAPKPQPTNTTTPLVNPTLQLAWMGAPTQPAQAQVSDMVWSPNGRYLAIAANPTVVLDIETNEIVLSVAQFTKKISWSANSELIVLGSPKGKNRHLGSCCSNPNSELGTGNSFG